MTYNDLDCDALIALCKERGLEWKSRLVEQYEGKEINYTKKHLLFLLESYDKCMQNEEDLRNFAAAVHVLYDGKTEYMQSGGLANKNDPSLVSKFLNDYSYMLDAFGGGVALFLGASKMSDYFSMMEKEDSEDEERAPE